MQPPDKKYYSFRADANALGGYLEAPFEKNIPTLAPVSLPAAGGFAMARSGAFTLDEIVTCSSAYTHVSGREHEGSISILVTAVVEGLNLLEVVTARRVVAQVSISIPKDGPPQVSVAGSGFEGLRLAGHGCPDTQRIGWERDGKLTQSTERIKKTKGPNEKNGGKPASPAPKTPPWVTSDPPPDWRSRIDGFEGAGPHEVNIPGFGRIILGQLTVTRDSVRLVAIRAELGCPVKGAISICCPGGGGVGDL
jgi:hypothetical protein